MRFRSIVLALSIAAISGGAQAATNLVKNGGFEDTVLTRSSEISPEFTGVQSLAHWTTDSYTMLMKPGTATTSGADTRYGCCLTFWGPGNGSENGYADSGTGNYLAADGAYITRWINQTITGMNPGEAYTLSFDWAGAQQYGWTGEGEAADGINWTVALGDQQFMTATIHNPEKGFIPWRNQTFTFTPTSSTAVLGFIAHGPVGVPPFALLDNVSLRSATAAVPEPATWALMITGFGLAGGVMRRRRALAAA
ncbi:MAG: PEPxxWA-CTERM sorting domain-containing protein [Pseudomonadota bacterium]